MATVCRQHGADEVDAGEVVWPVQGVSAVHAATTVTPLYVTTFESCYNLIHLMGAQLGGVSVYRQQSVVAGDTCTARAN